MVALRKNFERAVEVGLVPELERIDNHNASAGLEHSRALMKEVAPYLRRQLVHEEDAGHRVLAVVGEGKRLGLSDDEVDPAGAAQMPPRLGEVRLRQVEPDRRQARPGLLEEIE